MEADVINDLFLLYFQVTIDLRKSFLEVIIALATIRKQSTLVLVAYAYGAIDDLRSKVLKENTIGELVNKMQDTSEDVRTASADAIVELAKFGMC